VHGRPGSRPAAGGAGQRRPRPRASLLIGIGVYAAASVLCVVAPEVWLLIGLRLLQGLAGAAGIVIARAVVRDIFSGDEMARIYAYMMVVNGVAPIAAPVIGGQLLRLTDWRGIFAVLAVIGVALFAVAARWLPESLPQDRRRPSGLGPIRQDARILIADPRFTRIALATGLAFGVMFAYISGSSFVLQSRFGISPQLFSLIFAINGTGIVVVSQLSGRLAGRVSQTALFAAGLSGSAAGGVLVLITALSGGGLPLLLPALFILTASIGLVLPNGTALAMATHGERAGSAAGLTGTAQFAIGGVAAPIVGVAGAGTALPMGIVMSTLGISALLMNPRARSRHPAVRIGA
jgi:MFS transporter, DHA1 family, multidrug resistance protein